MIRGTTFQLACRQSISSLHLSEWRALLIALMLAVTIASLMAVLGERIERTLARQGSALLGADLVLSNSRPLSQQALTLARDMQLTSSEVVQLGTMANHQDQFQLVSVRALSAPYPRGEIVHSPGATTLLPEPGEVWAETGALERLSLSLGDKITLGTKQLTLTAIIESAPDRGRGFISFNPQLIIHPQDLTSMGLIGPGARVQYRQLFAGEPEQIALLEQQLKAQLQTGERIISLQSQENQQTGALTKASAYLRLGALFALLISAMTIFLSLRRFTLSQHKRAALLKSLGLSDAELLRLYLTQFGLAALSCSLAGLFLCVLLEYLSLSLFASLLPQPVPAAGTLSYLSGPMLGFTILLGLGLPALFRLQKSTTVELLQSAPAPLSWGGNIPYLLSLVVLLGATSLYLNNAVLTLSLSATLLLAGGILGWLGASLALKLAKRFAGFHPLGNLLLSRVQQQQRWYRLQIPVICLLFALLSINLVALNDLLSRWQAQLPADTPDHFLINIQDWEQQDVANLMQQHQIDNPLWPIYRGRLTQLNEQPLSEALSEEQLQHPSLNRELNLTRADQIPAHNQLISGEWQAEGGVSLEEKVARELGLKPGDKLGFNIGGQEVSAVVSSIRRLRWDSFQPNFYYIFSPGILEQLPASYITSFYLGENSASFSRQLISQFPTLTLIDVRQILNQLQQLLSRLSLLSSLLMLLTTSAGLVLLYVTLTQELEQRRYENALLQTLGASARQCKQLDRMEMGLVGGISGFLAVFISELSLWPIHQQLLQLDPVFHPWLWLALPLTSAGLFILISWISHRQQNLKQSYRTLAARS